MVSDVAFGTWGLGAAWGEVTEGSLAAVRRAAKLGVNLFDTAFAYGFGDAEEHLGRCLRDVFARDRDEVVVVSKGGLELTPHGIVRNSDPDHLRASLTAGLARMGVSHFDVYLVHWPDPTVPLAETAGALDAFHQEGLIRHIGVSNFSLDQIEEFSRGAAPDVVQMPYNLFRRGADTDVFPYCQERGIGIMGHQPYGGGLLTGALRRSTTAAEAFAADDWRRKAPEYSGDRLTELLDLVDEIAEIAERSGRKVSELALAWVRSHPAGVIPVTGADRPEYVDATVKACAIRLSPDERDRLSRLVAAVPEIVREGPAAGTVDPAAGSAGGHTDA
jgi:aryl-alcohol dehydrogenase-like predicted oxidoreductase